MNRPRGNLSVKITKDPPPPNQSVSYARESSLSKYDSINASFSEVTSPKNQSPSPLKLAKLKKYKPSTSLAEENLVQNYNKFSTIAPEILTNLP